MHAGTEALHSRARFLVAQVQQHASARQRQRPVPTENPQLRHGLRFVYRAGLAFTRARRQGYNRDRASWHHLLVRAHGQPHPKHLRIAALAASGHCAPPQPALQLFQQRPKLWPEGEHVPEQHRVADAAEFTCNASVGAKQFSIDLGTDRKHRDARRTAEDRPLRSLQCPRGDALSLEALHCREKQVERFYILVLVFAPLAVASAGEDDNVKVRALCVYAPGKAANREHLCAGRQSICGEYSQRGQQ
mmetsp:Transcript_9242/g.24296  ORF Transcript_9242/g.24296 Transcript_9242/m.24296 type:complete len:247 (+) Transcript_9242:700-1440(+)